ncbi:3032_t:CDS:2 [Ambispora leptoticha]|uniref:3032_t:CDS:1 n=1 Tax=Ambispora leptoticha TaxID=144679 RepID=A0A9N9C9S1_9GLOM|nr:3032_t:CDS:2 [Ambispora leptoticha]
MSITVAKKKRGAREDRITIAVSASERWIGNAIACGLMCERRSRYHDEECHIIALTRNPDSRHIRNLERYGAEIRETDFDSKETLHEALCGVDWLVFVAESNKDRIKEGKRMAKAAKRQDVGGVIVFSLLGTDEEMTYTQRESHKMEKIWRKKMRNCVILRVGLLQETLLLWSRMIKQESMLSMMLDERRDKSVPVNFNDVIEAILHFVNDDEMDKRHRRYDLTGPDAITPGAITDMLSSALRRDIEYEQISRGELEDYFRSLDERDQDVDELEVNRRRGDDHYRGDNWEYLNPCSFLPMREIEIEIVCDILEFSMKANMSRYLSNDLQKLIHQDPISMYEFIEENTKEFMRRDHRRHRIRNIENNPHDIKKTRCTGKPLCQRCKKFDLECVFIPPTKNRGPPKLLNNTVENNRRMRPYKIEKPFTTLPKINSLKSGQQNSDLFYSSILYINEQFINNNNRVDCSQNCSCQKIENAFNNCRMIDMKLDLPPLMTNQSFFDYSPAPTYEARHRSNVKLPSIRHLDSPIFNNFSEIDDASFMHPRPQTANNPKESFPCRYKESSNVEFENYTQFEPSPSSNMCSPSFTSSKNYQNKSSPNFSTSSNILIVPLPIRPKPREIDQRWGLKKYF